MNINWPYKLYHISKIWCISNKLWSCFSWGSLFFYFLILKLNLFSSILQTQCVTIIWVGLFTLKLGICPFLRVRIISWWRVLIAMNMFSLSVSHTAHTPLSHSQWLFMSTSLPVSTKFLTFSAHTVYMGTQPDNLLLCILIVTVVEHPQVMWFTLFDTVLCVSVVPV